MKIGIIGTGNLGKSIAKGILQSDGATSMYLSKRNTAILESFRPYKNVRITSDNKELVAQSDILIFAVQPSQFSGILSEIKEGLTDKHVIISTITGFSIQKIETIIGAHHFIIRAMPNTAIAVGQSMTCMCANLPGEKRVAVAKAIFDRMGHCMMIPESKMQAATVICASGIAFWMRLIRANTQGGVELGFEAADALELVVHTALGAASLLIENKSHPEAEIDLVTTPEGCTISGLNEMEHKGLSSALIQGIQKSFEKISHISKDQLSEISKD
jgi:pyrroline-5-carboxylate reductase